MLTPLFSLSQTDENLSLKLHVPLADLKNSEFLIEDGIAYFSAPPYYLKLEIPGSVVEDGDHIHIKLEGGDMIITMKKSTPGEDFEDLDLISKLIVTPDSSKPSKPGIQVLDSNEADLQEGETNYDWFKEQEVEPKSSEDADNEEPEIELTKFPYGFAASKSGLLANKPEVALAIDLPDADTCPLPKRTKLQQQSVQKHFQDEHYLADYFEDVCDAALNQKAPWVKDAKGSPELSNDHRHRLTVLAAHPLPLLPPLPSETTPKGVLEDRTFVYLGLVDLLLAYTYDYRSTEGEHNCESGWTIAKVAATLSWLEIYPNLKAVLRTFYERALSFPLHRNWKLCRKTQNDVAALLKHPNAKGWILFALLQIRSILIDYPGYYVFVDLFLDDYIVWLQKSASSSVLKNLGEAVASVKMKKSDVQLQLEELEEIGREVCDEALAEDISKVNLADNNEDHH